MKRLVVATVVLGVTVVLALAAGPTPTQACHSFGGEEDCSPRGAQWPNVGFDKIENHQTMGLYIGTQYVDEANEAAYSAYSWEGAGVVDYEPGFIFTAEIFIGDTDLGGGYVLAAAYLYNEYGGYCGTNPCNYGSANLWLNTTYMPSETYDVRVEVIDHELGHTFGLGDHWDCSYRALMTTQVVVQNGVPIPCPYYHYGIKYPPYNPEINSVYYIYWP
ncbi:MAG: hypothetical protein ACE5IZ_08460 [Dehalococcoidia bacterium]